MQISLCNQFNNIMHANMQSIFKIWWFDASLNIINRFSDTENLVNSTQLERSHMKLTCDLMNWSCSKSVTCGGTALMWQSTPTCGLYVCEKEGRTAVAEPSITWENRPMIKHLYILERVRKSFAGIKQRRVWLYWYWIFRAAVVDLNNWSTSKHVHTC